MEHSQEQSEKEIATPTEASEKFIWGWARKLTMTLSPLNAAATGGIAGKALAEGNNKQALIFGLFSGYSAFLSILTGLQGRGENK